MKKKAKEISPIFLYTFFFFFCSVFISIYSEKKTKAWCSYLD